MLSKKKKNSGISRETVEKWLKLFPNQNCGYRITEDGSCVLELPRAENKILKAIISLFAKSDTMKIKLDKTGSFIWVQCNGNNSIRQIVVMLEKEFGEEVIPAEERTILFFQHLYRYNLVKFYQATDEKSR